MPLLFWGSAVAAGFSILCYCLGGRTDAVFESDLVYRADAPATVAACAFRRAGGLW
jgi:hypothetical protein